MRGAEVPVDPATGKALETPFVPGVDRVWSVGNDQAKFGEFTPAPMDGFLKA